MPLFLILTLFSIFFPIKIWLKSVSLLTDVSILMSFLCVICAHFLIKEVWNLYALEICLVNHIDWTCAAFEWNSKFNHFYDHSSDVFYFQYALKGQVRTSICWNCFDFVNCLTKEQTRLVKDRVAEVTSRTELENNELSLKISQNVVQSIIWNGTSKPQPQFHRDVAVYPKRQSGIYQWGILGGVCFTCESYRDLQLRFCHQNYH